MLAIRVSLHLQLEQGIVVQSTAIDPSVNLRFRLNSSTELRCIATSADGIEWGGKWVSRTSRINRFGIVGNIKGNAETYRLIAVGEHDVRKITISWNVGGEFQNRTHNPWITIGAAYKVGHSIQILSELVYLPLIWSDSPQYNLGALYYVGPRLVLDVLIEPPSSQRVWGFHLGATTSISWANLRQAIPG